MTFLTKSQKDFLLKMDVAVRPVNPDGRRRNMLYLMARKDLVRETALGFVITPVGRAAIAQDTTKTGSLK